MAAIISKSDGPMGFLDPWFRWICGICRSTIVETERKWKTFALCLCQRRTERKQHTTSTASAPRYLNELASQFRLFPTFLLSVPLLVMIWSYPAKGYNLATGQFVWLVRSPGTVSHWTFVPYLNYQLSKTCSRHIFSHFPTLLTNSFQSTSSEHCTAPL